MMPSPLPGMDPFLEKTAIFHELHTQMLGEDRAAIDLATSLQQVSDRTAGDDEADLPPHLRHRRSATKTVIGSTGGCGKRAFVSEFIV